MGLSRIDRVSHEGYGPRHVSSRRRHALGIRLVQEMRKRLDGVRSAPTWSGILRVLHLLSPAALAELHAAPRGTLASFFAARTATRFPSKHLAGREQALLSGRGKIIQCAERLCRGEWDVFGHPVDVTPATLDWRTHPVSGVRTPERPWHRVQYLHGETGGDVKFIWELNRHEPLLRLAQAYHLTREPRYADAVGQHLARWMQQNPPGIGINWVSSLEIAFRAVAWCWTWSLTKDSAVWTDDLVAEFLWQLWHHARHVERFDSIHHSPNTHLTGEAIGLLYVSATFPELDRATLWSRLAVETLRSEIEYQLLEDGMHFERSTGYHRYTLEFYLHARLLLADRRLRNVVASEACAAFDEALARMTRAALVLRSPAGTWPVLGDEDGGRLLRLGGSNAVDQNALLVAVAALLGATDELRLGAANCDEAWWLLDGDCWARLRESQRPEQLTAPLSDSLPAAGYYVARDESDADVWFCVVDAGPHGGNATGHAHSDLAHVEVMRGGVAIVADSGSPSYTADPSERDWFRSEWAHACLCSDAAPLAQAAGPFGWRAVYDAPEVAVRDHGWVWTLELRYTRGLRGELVHRRQVALVRGRGVIVCDWMSRDDSGRAPLTLHWPLAMSMQELTLDAGTDAIRVNAGEITVACFSTGTHTLRPALFGAARSPTYGRRLPSTILSVGVPAARCLGICTCFSPRAALLQPARANDQTFSFAMGRASESARLTFAPSRIEVAR